MTSDSGNTWKKRSNNIESDAGDMGIETLFYGHGKIMALMNSKERQLPAKGL